MDQKDSRYRLLKKIAYLQEENNRLEIERRLYKDTCSIIHNNLIDFMSQGKTLNQSWIISQFKGLWR